MTVDQTTNQVTFSLPEGVKGVMPVWIFPDKKGQFNTYSSRDGLTKVFTASGDYTYRMKILGASGVSPDYYEGTFHIDNSMISFDKYITFLSGGSSKEWRIKGEADGHMACGEPGSDGTNWWSAKAWEKQDSGMYEDRMTFTSDGSYTYDSGDDGMTFVNKDNVTVSPYLTGQEADYNFAMEDVTTTYSFEVDGDDLYLVLGAPAFPYIPDDAWISAPKFKVLSANTKTIELVSDNGSIAWHFTLSCEEPDNSGKPFEGFKYNAESNLWLPADAAHTYFQFNATGNDWATVESPEVTYENGTYSFTLASASVAQWQSQFMIIPDNALPLSAGTNYDFSVKLTSSTDINGVTLKLTDTSDDGNYLFVEQTNLTALEEKIFYLTDLAGIDAASVKMVFDFGGNPENSEITISNIVLKDHAVDDGTVLPDDKPDTPETPDIADFVDYSDPLNLWKDVDAEGAHTFFQYYAPNWAQLENPAITEGNGTYSYSSPTATNAQWQHQFMIIPAEGHELTLTMDKLYDFKCKITSSTDIPNATIKLVDVTADGNYLFTENVALTAFEETEVKFAKVGAGYEKGAFTADAAVKMVFDFGGNPDNTDITISNIIIQEHRDSQSDGGNTSEGVAYDDPANIWLPADAAHTYSQYYAPGWAQLENPEVSYENGKYSFSCPSATMERWQNQFFIIPDAPIALSAEKKYGIRVVFNTSVDLAGLITVKVVDTTDDGNYLLSLGDDGTARLSSTAYEDLVYTASGLQGIDAAAIKMAFDFGGNPDNTDITISGITLWEE